MQRLVPALLALGLVATACGSEPDAVIVGAADEAIADAGESAISDAGATVSNPTRDDGPTSVDDLLGTSWVIETLNGEPYRNEAGLTFFVDNRALSVAHNDACSASVGQLRLDGETYRYEPWAPNTATCTNHPTALFAKADARFSITITNGVLSISGPTGQLTATHFQSVSIHDELLELPSVPVPDIPTPQSSNPSDVVEPDTTSLPLCDTLLPQAMGVDDLDSDVLSAMLRLHIVSDELPFATGVGIEEVSPAGAVVIEMSALYGPTIDWLAETLGTTPACVLLEADRGVADNGQVPATTVVIAPTTTTAGD